MSNAKPTRLSQETKQYIIARLACFASVADVVEELALLDPPVRVTHQMISRYNCAHATGQVISEELQKLFWDTRDAWSLKVTGVAIAHQRRRLELIERFVERGTDALPKGMSPALFLGAIELAEKIVAGSYAPRPAAGTVSASAKDGEGRELKIRVEYDDPEPPRE